MPRILPGVEITVVKEIVAPAVSPSGVLGLVGITDRGRSVTPRPVGSWPAFLEVFGQASATTMPEARQAIMNGVFELVVVPVDVQGAKKATFRLVDEQSNDVAVLTARAVGTWANSIVVSVAENRNGAGNVQNVDVTVEHPSRRETFTALVMDPANPKDFFAVINTQSSLVTAVDPAHLDSLPATLDQTAFGSPTAEEPNAFIELPKTAGATDYVVKLAARAPGAAGDNQNLKVKVTKNDAEGTVEVRIYRGNRLAETYEDLTMDPDDPRYLVSAVNENAESLIRAVDLYESNGAAPPAEGRYGPTDQGTNPQARAFQDAVDALESVENVDMVAASLPAAFYEGGDAAAVHSHVEAHCTRMSSEAKNRIGFGTVASSENANPQAIGDRAVALNSDRFVLVAPSGLVGAVAGRIGSLSYYQSPTFKRLGGVPSLEYAYAPSQLRQLVQSNVVAIELQRSRGTVIEKGIATSGAQISVTRVADHAVRGVKAIADLFIGTLNSLDGRMALRQKISEFFMGMQNEGAIVPSVDGTEPSFRVDVYSSEQDFGQGIVRVDIAVRPVRAIDYIYATITVEV